MSDNTLLPTWHHRYEPPLHWDSVARCYVEHDTEHMETFGPIKEGYTRKGGVNPARPAGVRRPAPPFPAAASGWPFGVAGSNGELQAANDNRRGAWIQTFTGRKFWPMDPRAEDVDIEDIAHALAMQCRYAGHCRRFYSVAEHSVHVANAVYSDASRLWGLLHDASEAYLTDVPRPVKPFLSGYKAAEAAVMAAVCERFGLPHRMPAEVHEVDGRILGDEIHQNMLPMSWHDKHDDPVGVTLQFWSPERAKQEFLETFDFLVGEQRRVG